MDDICAELYDGSYFGIPAELRTQVHPSVGDPETPKNKLLTVVVQAGFSCSRLDQRTLILWLKSQVELGISSR